MKRRIDQHKKRRPKKERKPSHGLLSFSVYYKNEFRFNARSHSESQLRWVLMRDRGWADEDITLKRDQP